ncbi:formylglycine-generating enzyme family protein [Ornithinimicrobium faecis]|uniref:formylglycine-generating enzyme family protein n=1 Tax=Ornithinimicrobium faecis TaxID=2934158 RepID=UPI0021177F6D|nr:formylglycine-generating enzyme family protein [Ornithinimicrobium sp. HY1745]
MSSTLVAIPAGSITLSDRRTSSRWEVSVAGFEIGVHPVTRQEYAEGLGEQFPPGGEGSAANELPAADGQVPATDVSWWDAVAHCNRLSTRHGLSPAYEIRPGSGDSPDPGSRAASPGLPEPAVIWDRTADGFRLPAEAEWEHACRAGTAGPRYGELDAIAWCRDNSGERPHGVGLKAANAFGLHDTLGNVWEWCWDVYDAEVYGSYRVLRGGGWFDEHWSCRASVRRRSHPTLRLEDVGFRVARGPFA